MNKTSVTALVASVIAALTPVFSPIVSDYLTAHPGVGTGATLLLLVLNNFLRPAVSTEKK